MNIHTEDDEIRIGKYKKLLEVQLQRGYSLEEAMAEQVDPDDPLLAVAVERVKDGQEKVWYQDDPRSLDSKDARDSMWYVGPSPLDKRWEFLKGGLNPNFVDSVDESSTKVVSRLSNPHHLGVKKRGLVLGYVQSGKTANYTATIAKAADAGYKIIIVLAGMHDNLRNQTQARLDDDLGLGNQSSHWHSLTHAEQDFTGNGVSASVLLGPTSVIAVVKKNKSRLVRLLNWLKELPSKRLEQSPVLLLDDEADQATPNSSTNSQKITAINQTLRRIWEVVPTGTYLAYTATPFANVFMDPDDDTDLFPADFIVSLPRPDDYFGAERIFGSEGLAEGSEPNDGLDMVRPIPLDEGDALRPSRKEKDDWAPDLPPSLVTAINWFLIATAIRRARGQDKHNSMLIHTSQFVAAHGAVAGLVRDHLKYLVESCEAGAERRDRVDSEFEALFRKERDAAVSVRSVGMPEWETVAALMYDIVLETNVIEDNGRSDDRLNYNQRDAEGNVIPQTVIAIGGATLSRGLTLEGLMVSYFSRPATTYDTLLQMGRWFGYRVGYEDLPRVWMTEQLAQEFLFLATVEQDLRNEIDYLERTERTPEDAGVRVREHPGRLAITGGTKMRHVRKVQMDLSGVMLQTFVFEEKDADVIRSNQTAVQRLVADSRAQGHMAEAIRNGRFLIRDVDGWLVRQLIAQYQFHEDQSELMPSLMGRWLEETAPNRRWNIVIASSQNTKVKSWEGHTVQLGQLDLGLGQPVNTVNRAPLKHIQECANIKALLSRSDRIADLDPVSSTGWSHAEFREHRQKHSDDRGLLLVYPISRHSVAIRAVNDNPSRRSMAAPDHLVGLGLVFPDGRDLRLSSSDWVSVRNRYDTAVADEQEETELESDAEEGVDD